MMSESKARTATRKVASKPDRTSLDRSASLGQGDLVSVVAAAELLGRSESTLWRLIRRGVLPSVIEGGRRLIPREALAAQSQRCRDGGVPPFGPDHPIFRLVGAGKSGGREPGARDKYSILVP